MDYIEVFEDTFYLYNDGKIDVSETSNMVKWYAQYQKILGYFNKYNSVRSVKIQKPESPQFTGVIEEDERIAYELYVFGYELYLQHKAACCRVHPQGYCKHALRASRIPSRYRKIVVETPDKEQNAEQPEQDSEQEEQ